MPSGELAAPNLHLACLRTMYRMQRHCILMTHRVQSCPRVGNIVVQTRSAETAVWEEPLEGSRFFNPF